MAVFSGDIHQRREGRRWFVPENDSQPAATFRAVLERATN
jgi:hypothetical protein